MFTKEECGTFKYWFAHWCAFQMTALNLKCWKSRFLLHDIEKPWLQLFCSHSAVTKFHRNHSKHHVDYYLNNGKADFESMVIDWECFKLTKSFGSLNASETIEAYREKLLSKEIPEEKVNRLYNEVTNVLYALGLRHKNE